MTPCSELSGRSIELQMSSTHRRHVLIDHHHGADLLRLQTNNLALERLQYFTPRIACNVQSGDTKLIQKKKKQRHRIQTSPTYERISPRYGDAAQPPFYPQKNWVACLGQTMKAECFAKWMQLRVEFRNACFQLLQQTKNPTLRFPARITSHFNGLTPVIAYRRQSRQTTVWMGSAGGHVHRESINWSVAKRRRQPVHTCCSNGRGDVLSLPNEECSHQE